tara:strand:+ start:513 stop:737 length:225 start_codon:yes stop_codon:yes gene_type:complete
MKRKRKSNIKRCLSKSFTLTGKTEKREFFVLGGIPNLSPGDSYSGVETIAEEVCDKCNKVSWGGSGNSICLNAV